MVPSLATEVHHGGALRYLPSTLEVRIGGVRVATVPAGQRWNTATAWHYDKSSQRGVWLLTMPAASRLAVLVRLEIHTGPFPSQADFEEFYTLITPFYKTNDTNR